MTASMEDVPPGMGQLPPGMEDVPPGYEGVTDVPEGGAPAEDEVAAFPVSKPDANLYSSDLTFADLGLPEPIREALLLDMKFERPSQIQARTLPKIINQPDRHMIAQGHNGCGKTTCFTLAMLLRVNPDVSKPQAICMCPTRELVIQNLAVLRKMAARTDPPITARGSNVQEQRVPGGRQPQITEHVIIGTPGTFEAWISRRRLALDAVRVIVYDEADQMLMTDGFQDQSMRMLHNVRKVSPDVQILLFSATFGQHISDYCSKIVPGAHREKIDKEELSLDVIKQHKVLVHGVAHKDEILKSYIFRNADKLGQVIIFVRTRAAADSLQKAMMADGHDCIKLAGDMEKEDRDTVVEQFRQMDSRVLITTDIVSRGFDVNTVTLVVNYDLPIKFSTHEPDYETYLHRIGRSGRFGNKGVAFNFVDETFVHRGGRSDVEVMQEIELYFNKVAAEVPGNDEDRFIEVLEDAGLMTRED